MFIRKKSQLFLMVIFLLALGIILVSGLHYRRHVIEMAEDNILMLVQSLAAQQEQITTGTKLMLSTLALLPEVQRLDTNS
ncbi:MAG: hypothetical protein KKC76_09190 [Proteobacteria bacterium]|nr:hypothetical protein [Pseudomonadota bacterium]